MSNVLELYPKDILGSFLTDNPFIAELAVKANFPSSTEGLAVISNVLLRFNVDILASNLTCKNNVQYMVFILDYTGIKGKIEEIVKELKKNPKILNVKYRTKTLDEKIISMFTTPTFNQGKYDALILGTEELGLVFERIKEVYGTGGEVLLYHIGEMLGEQSGKKYSVKHVTSEFIMEDFLAFQAFGWGIPKIEYVNVEEKTIVVRLYNLFESRVVKGKKDKVNCHFTRGYLKGIYSMFFNKKMKAEEVKCIAKGDPYCLFIIRPE